MGEKGAEGPLTAVLPKDFNFLDPNALSRVVEEQVAAHQAQLAAGELGAESEAKPVSGGTSGPVAGGSGTSGTGAKDGMGGELVVGNGGSA
jgi:hypothetical protein